MPKHSENILPTLGLRCLHFQFWQKYFRSHVAKGNKTISSIYFLLYNRTAYENSQLKEPWTQMKQTQHRQIAAYPINRVPSNSKQDWIFTELLFRVISQLPPQLHCDPIWNVRVTVTSSSVPLTRLWLQTQICLGGLHIKKLMHIIYDWLIFSVEKVVEGKTEKTASHFSWIKWVGAEPSNPQCSPP